ncbi:MAG TPA: lysylphosphatidylglycerol synthase transmembrane domain-containing protein [Thermomicrobiales bacterium]|nr:lysylphosphatidylglycerol synthase transmembrane domain-containing protein [Thermomicrobiales bacterium]
MSYERALADEQPAKASQAPEPVVADTGPSERSISLGERVRSPQTIISFVVAFAIIIVVFWRLDIDFADVWSQIRNADPFYLALAFAAYYGSFPLRALRWRYILANAKISREYGYNVPGIVGLSEIYILSWFVNCVVPAKLGDAYRGYLLKKQAGASFSKTLGTIFAERLLDVVALVGLMLVSGLLVFHGTVPSGLRWWFVAGAALVVIGIGGLVALMTVSHRIEALLPERFQPYYNRLSDGIVSSFSRQGFSKVAGLTILIWALEGARVYFGANALGIELNISQSIFIALLASLLTTFPFTPAGMGVVEGGTVFALRLFDVTAASATAAALLDRTIASYSVVLFGGLLYFISKRK